MTVAQTNISILKTSNRNLKLEVAQQKHYIEELEERLAVLKQNNEQLETDKAALQKEFDDYKEAHPETTEEEGEGEGGEQGTETQTDP